MTNCTIGHIDKTEYPAVVDVWEASVRATHHFLKESDIELFKPLILNDYLHAVELRCARNEEKEIIGFLGVAGNQLEMLFIHPDHFRKGIGRKLLHYALDEMKIAKVDVNEQNPGATVFYLHCGFEVTGRSETDPMGNPYPILHLTYTGNNHKTTTSIMNTPAQIARHFRDVHFGGNWTCVNLKDSLSDITWQEAVTKLHNLNTIVALAYHINYYVSAVLKVLQGGELDAHDRYSYAHPEIGSQAGWEALLNKMWTEAEAFAVLVEQLPEEKLSSFFSQEKYGTYYRNLHGIIEHSHYHLGQIVVIKKMLREEKGK